MLATPSYGPTSPTYTFAIARSRQALSQAGIDSAYLLLHAFCHVDDSRNKIVREFLESDCTDLVFLDSDVDWEPEQLVQLCQRDVAVVGGIYPYRREGSEEMPVRLKEGAKVKDGLLEVEGLPTGFMKIKRNVLEIMANDAPKYFDKITETALVFDRPTPGPDKTRWGGDVDFCNRWRAMGGRLFADQEIRLGHAGEGDCQGLSGFTSSEKTWNYAQSMWLTRSRQDQKSPGDYSEAFKYAGNNLRRRRKISNCCRGHSSGKCRAGPSLRRDLDFRASSWALLPRSRCTAWSIYEHYAAQTLAWCEEAGVR